MTRMHDDPGARGRAMAVQDVTGAPVTVHITGFEPFDGAASNASWDAVRFLPEIIELVGGSAIVTPERPRPGAGLLSMRAPTSSCTSDSGRGPAR